MTRVLIVLLTAVLASCAPKAAPLPPVPPMPADLSPDTWSRPQRLELPPPPIPEPEPEPPPLRPAAANERLYAYEPGVEYEVLVQLGTPAAVELEAGEKITGCVDGDRAPLAETAEGKKEERWQLRDLTSGAEYTPIAHVLFTCTHPGQQQGVRCATTRRMYALALKCVGKTAYRTVRWSYPPPPPKPAKPLPPPPPKVLPATEQTLHVGYTIEPADLASNFGLQTVVDTGTKTYLVFSPVTLYQNMPLVREIGPNGPAVLNYHQFKTVLIVDKLIDRLELRLGAGETAQLVRITRGAVETIACPQDLRCPQWPAEP